MRLIKIKPFLYTKLIEASRRKNKNRALVQDKLVLWIKKLKTKQNELSRSSIFQRGKSR